VFSRWTEDEIPNLSAKTAVVTGASAGLGLQTASVLAKSGARVVMACRDLDKAAAAAARMRERYPRADLRLVRLDLASLASVRDAAKQIREQHPQIDLLINNAGVMEPPYRRTGDGFELTFATNHLGPFAFTGHLIDRLMSTPGSRVVTISSEAHARGVIDFDDLQAERAYDPDRAYAQSKLANILFTYELQRRLTALKAPTIALAAHPGIVLTDLFSNRSRANRALLSTRLKPLNWWLAQDVRMGALPALRAATDPAAQGGEFYGPRGPGFTGYPVVVRAKGRSHDHQAQARLWQTSERLTGVSFGLDGANVS
jgi:NAD(P)-dependent dehydrogenase (short-subunit alcohol dehydrogenase family)